MAIKKKLVCFKKQANFDQKLREGEISDYSIVFIKDTQRIWTHGVYFSSLKELKDALEGKQGTLVAGDNITIDENTISAKDTTYTLSIEGNVIKLTPDSGDASTITIPLASTSQDGLLSKEDKEALEDIKETVTALEEALGDNSIEDKFEELEVESTDKTIKVSKESGTKTDLAVNIDNKTIVKDAQGQLSVSPSAAPTYTGTEAIEVTGSETEKQIALKIADANKFLSQSSNGLLASLQFKDDSENHKIQLVGISDAVVAEFDYAKFIVDGMLDDATINESDELVLTMNTAAGSKELKVNLAKYIDVYTAGIGIQISSKEISLKVKAGELYLEVTADGLATTKSLADKLIPAGGTTDQGLYKTADGYGWRKEEISEEGSITIGDNTLIPIIVDDDYVKDACLAYDGMGGVYWRQIIGVPEGGKPGQVLMTTESGLQWVDLASVISKIMNNEG